MSQDDSRYHTDRLHNYAIKEHFHLLKEVNYRIWQWCLRYFSLVMRMNNGRYPKIALLGGVYWIRQRKRPPKCWIDSIKEDCGTLSVTIKQASRIVQDRNNWRTVINGLPVCT